MERARSAHGDATNLALVPPELGVEVVGRAHVAVEDEPVAPA
jgi:hypothetical protein